MTEQQIKKVNEYIIKNMSVKQLNKLLMEEMCPPDYSPSFCDNDCEKCWLQASKGEKQVTLEQRIMLDILSKIIGIPFDCRTYKEAEAIINNHKDDLERGISRAVEATLTEKLTEEE